MSKAINSPTGRLLRNSRLFSLPIPLPAAPVASSTAGQILRTSDTATQPYPTHQAITAPASSRSRGDWGLKRPLPDRAIPKNYPHLRIKAIDTLEHITDFESAADHTQSLAKWQEMNIPLSLPPNSRNHIVSTSHKSRPNAFSEAYDNTTLLPNGSEQTTFTAERALRERRRQTGGLARWKTQGPHLTSLTEEEFERYLFNLVRQHKQEFRKFLAAVKLDKNRNDQKATMRDHADPATFDIELEHRARLDKYELDDWIKELRDNQHDTSSELATLVREFFDLPAFSRAGPRSSTFQSTKTPDQSLAEAVAVGNRSDAAPPSTHPSAGLSYLQSSAIVNNHPIYGPQADREPVQARVLKPKDSNRNRDNRADVGLGGFVTTYQPGSVFAGSRFKASQQPAKDPLHTLDLSVTGGNKVWLQPRYAYVDDAGRIRLDVGEASKHSVDIKAGNAIQEEKPVYSVAPGRQQERLDSGFGSANYGRALPDERLRQPARAQPFERTGEDYKAGLEQIEALARGTGQQQS
ncbi:hypothetical protein E4T42_06810 [Aureobasidium subglaciale]|uniref:Uncharacterized protein n=1 Tax=Aureobasidium subglaciale (strain EXF-2481) TaxID=1043005 RepID=A0A074YZ97_AURSE|nr:uncharacterized protein AUEXF2481DRAFT_43248 [Aureobasidium subglaciale EXF-2481]KAI5207952.1 hypothetical protein E4T38_03141 [Aureobasidium subglaciale]KAI5226910.1 hypothetical protein E4T40_02915 [Aureobasidium subglaciale]KAI5230109.1 hypothetical protein E4T41_03138 [Aureobasidium subglaciale]KAI5245347.1 hypothetical protein E4T42_06810 [Aureobasidium subglaciale]KAI5264632.1 hypothetical protein E4T46_02916 [Aureobasidium subglaciale]